MTQNNTSDPTHSLQPVSNLIIPNPQESNPSDPSNIISPSITTDLPPTAIFRGPKKNGKGLNQAQLALLPELMAKVEEKCRMDPDWNADRIWLLGHPDHKDDHGCVYGFLARKTANLNQIWNSLTKGVNRRRLAKLERAQHTSTLIQTSNCSTNQLTKDPMTQNSTDEPNSIKFSTLQNLPQASPKNASISPPNRSTSPAALSSPSGLSSSLITSSLHTNSLTFKDVHLPNQTLSLSDFEITGNFLLWGLSPSKPGTSARKPISNSDILELPAIITDRLAKRFMAYKYHESLLAHLKLNHLHTPDALINRCLLLKQSLDRPWGYLQEQFIKARSEYNKNKQTKKPLNLQSMVIPFHDLDSAKQARDKMEETALLRARQFCNEPSFKTRLMMLTDDPGFEPDSWAQSFCESEFQWAKCKPIERIPIRRAISPPALSIQTPTSETKHLDHHPASDVEPINPTRLPSTPTHSIENHSNLTSPVAIPPTGSPDEVSLTSCVQSTKASEEPNQVTKSLTNDKIPAGVSSEAKVSLSTFRSSNVIGEPNGSLPSGHCLIVDSSLQSSNPQKRRASSVPSNLSISTRPMKTPLELHSSVQLPCMASLTLASPVLVSKASVSDPNTKSPAGSASMNELRDSNCIDRNKQNSIPRATPDPNQGDSSLDALGFKSISTHDSSFRHGPFTLYANDDGPFAPPASNDRSADSATARGVNLGSSSEESQLQLALSLLQRPSSASSALNPTNGFASPTVFQASGDAQDRSNDPSSLPSTSSANVFCQPLVSQSGERRQIPSASYALHSKSLSPVTTLHSSYVTSSLLQPGHSHTFPGMNAPERPQLRRSSDINSASVLQTQQQHAQYQRALSTMSQPSGSHLSPTLPPKQSSAQMLPPPSPVFSANPSTLNHPPIIQRRVRPRDATRNLSVLLVHVARFVITFAGRENAFFIAFEPNQQRYILQWLYNHDLEILSKDYQKYSKEISENPNLTSNRLEQLQRTYESTRENILREYHLLLDCLKNGEFLRLKHQVRQREQERHQQLLAQQQQFQIQHQRAQLQLRQQQQQLPHRQQQQQLPHRQQQHPQQQQQQQHYQQPPQPQYHYHRGQQHQQLQQQQNQWQPNQQHQIPPHRQSHPSPQFPHSPQTTHPLPVNQHQQFHRPVSAGIQPYSPSQQQPQSVPSPGQFQITQLHPHPSRSHPPQPIHSPTINFGQSSSRICYPVPTAPLNGQDITFPSPTIAHPYAVKLTEPADLSSIPNLSSNPNPTEPNTLTNANQNPSLHSTEEEIRRQTSRSRDSSISRIHERPYEHRDSSSSSMSISSNNHASSLGQSSSVRSNFEFESIQEEDGKGTTRKMIELDLTEEEEEEEERKSKIRKLSDESEVKEEKRMRPMRIELTEEKEEGEEGESERERFLNALIEIRNEFGSVLKTIDRFESSIHT
ncbi:hypothetical protein DFH28DRAFT_1106667 [Melampsora americana]|nr:hypothetical protein DFH28DRAFT_1106667 [Melampsora americana]